MSIADKIQRLNAAKAAIASAITGKGGTVQSGDGFEDFSADIATIPSGITPTGNINITSTSQVDVTNYATAQVADADLVPGNIKKDVDILGVVGTYEGGGGGVASGEFTSATEGYEFSFDTGLQPEEYNMLQIVRTNIDRDATQISNSLFSRFVDFGGGWSYWVRQGNATTYSPGVTTGTDLTQTRWKVDRSGTVVSFSGYSNAPKVEAGGTYRWLAWNEVAE